MPTLIFQSQSPMVFNAVVPGRAQQGDTLNALTGQWLYNPTVFAYQWQQCDPNGQNCSNIGGATTSAYTLVGTDVGKTIRVIITAINGEGSQTAPSANTSTVFVPPILINVADSVSAADATPALVAMVSRVSVSDSAGANDSALVVVASGPPGPLTPPVIS